MMEEPPYKILIAMEEFQKWALVELAPNTILHGRKQERRKRIDQE